MTSWGGCNGLFLPVTKTVFVFVEWNFCCFKEWIISLFLGILSKYRLVTLVSGTWRGFVSPFKSASAKGVSLSVPRRDCSGSTVKGEPCVWLRWCELRSATSSSISVGLSIVLKTTFFFPLYCSNVLRCRLGHRWFGWSYWIFYLLWIVLLSTS